MSETPPDSPSAREIPVCAIAVSLYNGSVTEPMLRGAIDAYVRAGGDEESLAIVEAPGAYDLVAIAANLAHTGRYDAVVCLGCVIKGETEHDRHIAGAVAHNLAAISVETGVPVAFGVLTTNTVEQARARAGGDAGNKGAEAMLAALASAEAVRAIEVSEGANVRYTPGLRVHDKAKGGT